MRLYPIALAALLAAPAVAAQESGRDDAFGSEEERGVRSGRTVQVDPYIEVSQILTAELSPGDDVLTFTQLAAGVDASVAGRRNAGSVSLRYERNIGWGSANDSDVLTGLARGYTTIVPDAVTLEAGALASRTSVDVDGRSVFAPNADFDNSSQTYAAYIGPNVRTRVDDIEVTGSYRLGYTRVEAPDIVTTDGRIDVFDESVTHNAQARLGFAPGTYAPVGVGVGAGYFREDVDTLDQRVEDAYVRADVTIPVTPTLAVVGGVGYEDVEVSSRDALRDAAGVPVLGRDGRIVTDEGSPRVIAFEADGLIWDVGVLWRPSRRTSLSAGFGRRYDSDTFYGNFAWTPNRNTTVNVSAYDGISGFGGRLGNTLAALPTDFEVIRDPFTGQILGCTTATGGGSCLDGLLGSVRSSVFRSRGVAATFSRRVGRYSASISAGYDNRRFIGAPGTVLALADGVTDESIYLVGAVSGELTRNSSFSVTGYVNRFDSGFVDGADGYALGSSAAYYRTIAPSLTARAAVSLNYIDSDRLADDLKTASALVGLRYGF